MNKIVLNVEERTEFGTKNSEKLRKNNYIPIVMYGASVETSHLKCKTDDVKEVLAKNERLLTLKSADKEQLALVKNIQYNALTDSITHIDFHVVSLTEKAEVEVPLIVHVPEGCPAEKGIVQEFLSELKVKCLPTEIPHNIEIDISEYQIGDSVSAKDIKMPENVELATDPENLVLTINEKIEQVIEETLEDTITDATEEASEPEIIKKSKDNEEQE